MEHPADFPEEQITTHSAEAAISGAFPEFADAHVELLDEGWDFRVFEVDSRWLFRFPKREEGLAKLDKERRLLEGLVEWLPLPVPSYAYFSDRFNGSRRPFAGYKKLPGVGGDLATLVDRQRVAQQLGEFLSRLHAYPAEEAGEARVPERKGLVTYWRDKSRKQLSGLDDLQVDPGELDHFLQNDIPASYEGKPRLIHSDLWAEHILIDPDSGAVSGIIDWGDAAISDPAADFALLLAWYGAGWLESVFAHYSGPVDNHVLLRSRYLAACQAIHSITLGQALDRPQWVKTGQEALRWAVAP